MTTNEDSNTFSSNESLGYLASVSYRAINKTLSNNLLLRGVNVSAEQYGVLKRLWVEEGLTQLDIARLTSKDKPSITRLLNNLEKKKLIERVVNNEDKRCNKIYLTAKGKGLKKICLEVAEMTIRDASNSVEAKEMIICKKVLAQVCENLIKNNNL